MKKLIIITILFLQNSLLVQAQEAVPSAEKRIAFALKLDNRFSYARDQLISIYGFRTGLKFNGKHEFGIGLNWLATKNNYDIPPPPPTTNGNIPSDVKKMRGRFLYKYFGLYYEYTLYKKNSWDISFPIQFGAGKSGISISDNDSDRFLERREAQFLLFEPAFNVSYKIWRYFGIGTGAGYRFAFSKQDIVNESLTKPVYILKLKIYVGEIYNAIKCKKR